MQSSMGSMSSGKLLSGPKNRTTEADQFENRIWYGFYEYCHEHDDRFHNSVSPPFSSIQNSKIPISDSRGFRLGLSNLWFQGWTPTTAGSTIGAAFGLFFLAIFSRALAAFSTLAEIGWAESLNRQAQLTRLQSRNSTQGSLSKESSTTISLPPPSASGIRRSTAFTLGIDLPRALLFMVQAFIGYLLMLAVMTYSTWFFLAILLGLAVGELGFGRFVHGGNGTGVHV